ncbi:MAG: alpha/beta hydrolase [Anaeroplasmataceae bacterium]|nr:alpha/beta hydrolase [Anaeroplasmataceae bacterium]
MNILFSPAYIEGRLVIFIFLELNNLKLHYEVTGEGEPFILLHGWGANLRTFDKLAKDLSGMYKVYTIDLPGFGESEIGVPLDIYEVVEVIHQFCMNLQINCPILLGHSYGGRIAIVYASMYQVKKLILVSAAGLKQKLRISKKIKVKVYKIFKKMHLPIKMGSSDYQNADNVKRIMLVKAVNQDLKEEMKKITSPTFLIYGVDDKTTPITLARQIKEYIPDAYLVELEDCGHFPYIDRPSYFTLVLMSYLIGQENTN